MPTRPQAASAPRAGHKPVDFQVFHEEADLPESARRPELIRFFHECMKPYEDRPEDVARALDYAFSERPGEGGFLVLGRRGKEIVSGLVMLRTGMGGYVPENLLLFVATRPELRGQGIGRRICERALAECRGAVKLHVEHENPAKRLYERLGFRSRYAEMRLAR